MHSTYAVIDHKVVNLVCEGRDRERNGNYYYLFFL